MDFDDLYQNGRKRDLSKGKKIRFCCIFLVVAVVTGLIVWKIIPRSSENAVQKKSGTQSGITSSAGQPSAVPEKKAVIPDPPKQLTEQKKDLPSAKKTSGSVVIKEPVPAPPAGQGGGF